MGDIYLPAPLYRLLPLLCIIIATLSIPLPSGLFKIVCIVLLYAYGVWVYWMRLFYGSID